MTPEARASILDPEQDRYHWSVEAHHPVRMRFARAVRG
jgi:hypothetical protein